MPPASSRATAPPAGGVAARPRGRGHSRLPPTSSRKAPPPGGLPGPEAKTPAERPRAAPAGPTPLASRRPCPGPARSGTWRGRRPSSPSILRVAGYRAKNAAACRASIHPMKPLRAATASSAPTSDGPRRALPVPATCRDGLPARDPTARPNALRTKGTLRRMRPPACAEPPVSHRSGDSRAGAPAGRPAPVSDPTARPARIRAPYPSPPSAPSPVVSSRPATASPGPPAAASPSTCAPDPFPAPRGPAGKRSAGCTSRI